MINPEIAKLTKIPPKDKLIFRPRSLKERLTFDETTLNPSQQYLFNYLEKYFYNGKCRIILVSGGSRAGKTMGACKAGIYMTLGHPERLRVGRGCIISASLTQADEAKRHLDNWFGFVDEDPPGIFLDYKIDRNGTRKYWIESPNLEATRGKPYEIHLRTGRAPNAIRSGAYDWIIIDEGLICKKLLLDVCISRLNDADGILILASTPNHLTPMLRELLEREKSNPEEVHIFEADALDNYFTDQEAIKRRAALYSRRLRDQEIHGKISNVGGEIFPTFNLNKHTRDMRMDEILEICQSANTTICAGVDFGATDEHKFAVVWGAERYGYFYILWEEQEGSGCDIDKMAKAILNSPLHKYTAMYYGDNEASSIIRSLRLQYGIPIYPCVKKDPNRDIVKIMTLLNQNKLIINSTDCIELPAQLSMYGYDDKGRINKVYDDHIDALRYYLSSYVVKVKKEPEKMLEPKNPDGTWNLEWMRKYRLITPKSYNKRSVGWVERR